MALNLRYIAQAVALSAAALILIGCRETPPVPVYKPVAPASGNDSPIEVVGGTIHICTASPITPPVSGSATYIAAGDTTKVLPLGVSGLSTTSLDWTKPWTLKLSNLDMRSWSVISGAITLSPDPTNPTTEVDIVSGSNGVWKYDTTKQTIRTLKFHDDTACKGDSEGSPCDHLVNVEAIGTTPAGASVDLTGLQCLGGACKIIIGNRGDDDCE